MGATNTTTHYNLSQFVSTDKPAWLQDYNGDMAKIDAGINESKVAADTAQTTANTANSAASQAASDITSLETTVTGQGANITALQLAVNTINSLIGNGLPTTTDQTIIGGINEINAKIDRTYINSNPSDISTNSYTATEDCIIYIRSAAGGSSGVGQATAEIGSLPVYVFYNSGNSQIQNSTLVPLKSGQTITFSTTGTGNWVARKVYTYTA